MTEQLTAAEFFYVNAGFSYDPHRQTRDEGRQECARALAMAERWASETGVEFRWSVDQDVMSEPDRGDAVAWMCEAMSEYGCIAGLGGVEFANDEPWGNDYRRVVEAELALEAMGCNGVASALDFLAIRPTVVGLME